MIISGLFARSKYGSVPTDKENGKNFAKTANLTKYFTLVVGNFGNFE